MKEYKIGENMSSGAEKVENVIREKQAEEQTNIPNDGGRVALNNENDRAAHRVEHAIHIAEQKKARAVQAEQRRAQRRERKAAERFSREQKLQERLREEEKRRKRTPGFGGWLAAVVTLGAVCLILATVVTVGAIDMSRAKQAIADGYRGSLYELVGIVENIDNDLDRARISASPEQQSRILTDMLVQARVAETDVEKIPVAAEEDANLSNFFNTTARTCERLLSKIRDGGSLDEQDVVNIEKLYVKSHKVRQTLAELASTLTTDDMMLFIKGGENKLSSALRSIEEMTMDENKLNADMGGGKEQTPPHNRQKSGENTDKGETVATQGGGENSPKQDEKKQPQKIDVAKAEKLLLKYFKDYNVQSVSFLGEMHEKQFPVYNFELLDGDENSLYAQVSAMDGTLVRFNYYRECQDRKFDVENAKTLAENFLTSLGYESVTAIRSSELGTDEDFLFCYEQDGVVYYEDAIKVKVCLERGVVSGMDALQFMKNHRGRVEPSAKLNLSQAREKLHKNLSVDSARMCVIKAGGKERCAYEFLCSYKDENYLVYIDADTGRELSIINTKTFQ